LAMPQFISFWYIIN